MENSDFYKEEVRQGYKITATQKRIWADQLEMLDIVEKICNKYKLSYFADSGTLIGAVREKGYIPWDDDIDLVMFREDYEKFVQAAVLELPKEFIIQTPYLEKNYLKGHAQLRKKGTQCATAEDKKAGYSCGVFIDIFPLDHMPDHKIERKLWAFSVRFTWMILYTWYRHGYYENITIVGRILYAVGKILHCPMKKAFSFYDKICQMYNKKSAGYVCNTVFIHKLEKNTWKKEWFLKTKKIPFENRMINIPLGYDGRLKAEYGDYMTPVQAPTEHGELLYEK